MVPPLTLPFRPPPSSSTAANPPILAPAFSSVAQPQMGIAPYAPTPTQSSIAPMQPVKAWTVPPNYMSGSMRVPSPVTSTSIPPLPPQSGMLTSSGTAPSFTPIRSPTATAPKPLQTNSSDFTFQPHRPQNPPSQASLRPGSQPPPQNLVMQPPQVPQTLSFPTAMDNFARPPIMHGFQQPQASNLLSQPRAHLPPSSAGNPISSHSLSRHPAFTNPSVVTPSQIELRNFGPAPRTFNPAGHLPPRPAIPLQLQQNYPAMAAQPRGLLAPNQQPSSSQPFLSGKPASVSGLQPIYDPFSPTSVSRVPQLGANSPQVKKQENDPEYDDLMASEFGESNPYI
ncbi:hypothetical protein RJ639_006159 [Escallonia herrerae]|uniref:Uncharacterized protein n=1 Tax=Escallonia herrerae TaxID=1293975 RepID=A0AA89AUV7_9ASTE|nr:hypothetical protein RJ639_006159 [Escallonia herrerae]